MVPHLRLIRLFIILMLCCYVVHSSAQDNIPRKPYSRNEIKAKTIYRITQDHNDFLWIGSNEGLYRFDGIEYKQYTVDDGLMDMEVFDLSIDSQNNIFISDFSYSPLKLSKGEIFNNLNHKSFSNIDLDDVQNLYHNEENAFIIYGSKPDYYYYLKYDEKNTEYIEKIHHLPDSNFHIYKVLSNNEHLYFFSSTIEKGIYKVFKENKFIAGGDLPTNILDIAIINSRLFILYFENQAAITEYSINEDFSLNNLGQVEFDFKVRHLFSLNQELWVSFIDGGIARLQDLKVAKLYMPDKNVNTIFIDKDSTIWFGTASNGLYYLQESQCINYTKEHLQVSGSVMSIAHGKNDQLYIGFEKSFLGCLNDKESIYNIELKGHRHEIFRRVKKLELQDNDKLICATDRALYDVFLSAGIPKKGREMLRAPIKDFIITKEGNYWVGASSALHFLSYKDNTLSDTIIWQQRVVSLHQDDEEDLWIGSLKGIFLKRNNSYAVEPFLIKELVNKKVNDIVSWNEKLIVSTDFGIYFIDKKTFKWQSINVEHGLLTNQCRKIFLYGESLLVSSSSGITKLNLINEEPFVRHSRNYTTRDGLISNDINDLIYRNDTIWVATNKGLSILPLSRTKNAKPPTTNIVRASTNSKPHSIYKRIVLNPDENNISIGYSGMSYYSDQYESYEYRLLPIAKNWSSTNESSITFHELQPGAYTFEVRAINDGIKGKTPAQLNFEVRPSLTQTNWFKFFSLIAFLVLLASLWLWRERELAKKNEFEKTVSRLELETIKAQINPHFIYNSLNSIKNTVVKKDHFNAEKQLSIFTRLVRQTLKISQQNFIMLNQEVEYLRRYLQMEKIRFGENLSFEIPTLSELNEKNIGHIPIPTMLIQPFVENAVKYGINPDHERTCFIKVSFQREGSLLRCRIEDNGPGIKNGQKRMEKSEFKPQGTRISSFRRKSFKKLYDMQVDIEIVDKSELNSKEHGTVVEIIIPIKTSHG